MIKLPRRLWRRMVLASATSWFCASVALAIDNPDAPDLLSAFQSRAEAYEARAASAGTVRETAAAYAAYEQFLDGELQKAYAALASRLTSPAQAALTRSQHRWLAYRDAEFAFVEENWTAEQFGTSAALSRGAYRTSILKERTATLLQYLRNYR